MQGLRRLLILAFCSVLTCCGYDAPALYKLSLQQTTLPPTVARMVVSQYLGAQWVDAPFVYPSGFQCLFFGKVPIHITDLDHITYDDLSGHLILGKSESRIRYHDTVYDCMNRGVLTFDGLGPERAHQLVAALIALGAPLDPSLGSGDQDAP